MKFRLWLRQSHSCILMLDSFTKLIIFDARFWIHLCAAQNPKERQINAIADHVLSTYIWIQTRLVTEGCGAPFTPFTLLVHDKASNSAKEVCCIPNVRDIVHLSYFSINLEDSQRTTERKHYSLILIHWAVFLPPLYLTICLGTLHFINLRWIR